MRTCPIDGCDRMHEARGYCGVHYRQWRKEQRNDAQLPTCSENDCDRPSLTRGMCSIHYRNWRERRGKVPPPPPRTCSVEGCDSPHNARGYCLAHYMRLIRSGAIELGPPQWEAEQVAYKSAHYRVTRLHGPARNHACCDCGEPADEWSYDHSDPDELRNPDTGSPYSLDPTRYTARCLTCHRQYDNQHRKDDPAA